MAPPLPPPAVPPRAGFAPRPTARLPVKVLLSTRQETPMLLNAPPLLHRPPRKELRTTYTGRSRCWSSTRTAAPPRSGPRGSHRLPTKRVSTILRRPPRTKSAPPPPPSYRCPVELPCARVRCCTTSRG